ncbi:MULTISPECIES: hypothetical protein [Stenotrophomonas]|uniref:Uncharacterized protein n=2 Tax=Stenotrophomonas maltophilia TaxID=40324 RepID=A0AAJ3JZA7_STEMA|nr:MULTISPECIES: hypothetical protein [Stenotrophomonas]MCV4211932.1 hypothetical protein [Pseudomonas cichorii]OMP39945.1 hypothetical protein BMR86_09930 [Stenotrophomonas sp. KAs 5-3]SSM86126.1 Uncharacterised protein [Acinetobacter baumannii]AIL07900.1 putative secreted protein [Stenotrophomonas maltophilia]ASE54688.1 hypothetical protein CEQ03_19370 [Stenotrophomonas maltophilia]
MYRITMIALLLGLAGSAAAKPEKSVVQMDRQSPVAEQVRQVEKALDDGDYSEISADDRSTVREALARITARMGGHQSVQELPPQVQGEVFNDQERINTLLTRAHEDSRQICQHTRSTGSNMPKSRCLTVAERRRIEEKGKALLNDQRTFNNFNPASSR